MLIRDAAPPLGLRHFVKTHRESFRELVLDGDGRLRWNRLENLIEEGSKSLDYDPQQLWLLAQWVLGEQGVAVRKPLVDELARLIDAAVAGDSLTRKNGQGVVCWSLNLDQIIRTWASWPKSGGLSVCL